MLYIIYTEDVNREGIEAIVSKYAEGFTLVEGKGFWHGVGERSLQVQLVDVSKDVPEAIIREINAVNKQEACMLLAIPCDVEFL